MTKKQMSYMAQKMMMYGLVTLLGLFFAYGVITTLLLFLG